MNRLFTLAVSLLLSSCTAQAQNPTPSPSPSLHPSPAASLVSDARSTKRFTLKLTLTAPEDLKVKEADVVVADPILRDRTKERQRLEAQKKAKN